MANNDNPTNKEDQNDKDAMEYFLALKSNYSSQRQPWEQKWTQALASYNLTDKLDKIYEGRSQIQVPIMKWKVNGMVSRINRILFNISPIGRLEDTKIEEIDNNLVDLWNKYIFDYQLDQIDFKHAFKKFIKNKTIEGTAVAKITQEFEEKLFTFFDDKEPETLIVKDNTYFRNILLTEFYSDVNKEDINDSQACIHSTSVSFSHLKQNEIRIETTEEETEDGIEIASTEVGFYKNLDLITMNGENYTDQQAEYIQNLGLNKGQTVMLNKMMKETNKTGFVHIDECYGLYDLEGDGIFEEVVCTIAHGRFVIRLEKTPFKHKRYVRPFIIGKYHHISNCLYGDSNVISSKTLVMELNASRAQATDAKTRSISNMWYLDASKSVKWDGVWRPNGKVKGQGQNGMVPLINPNLSNVSINDSEMASRDLDQLWSLSPVQEGTSDSRLIPNTASGTRQIISQNDMPLNDIIDNTIEYELKPFIEMVYERNLVFKNFEDLLVVWEEKDIQKADLPEDTTMAETMFDFNVKILGNLELSNEVAHQQGWQQFIHWATVTPPIARRLDWQAVGQEQLKAFGIKDVSENIWLDSEIVAEIQKEEQQAQQSEIQGAEQQRQKLRGEAREDATFGTELSTEADLVKMQSEAIIEKTTGQKIQ